MRAQREGEGGEGKIISRRQHKYNHHKLQTKCAHQNNTVEPLLEPRHGVIPLDSMLAPYTRPSLLSPCNTGTRATHHNIEVHPKDTNTRIISRAKINVLLDTETKVPSLREVLPTQFVLLHLETALKDLFCLGAADGDVDGNLLVTTDTECADGVAGFRGDGCLTGELLEDFGGTGETIAGLANTDVCTR